MLAARERGVADILHAKALALAGLDQRLRRKDRQLAGILAGRIDAIGRQVEPLDAHFDGQRLVESVFDRDHLRSEEHTSEIQSLMRISYAVFCLKKKKIIQGITTEKTQSN